MNFIIIREAEASIETLMKSVNKVIINPIIILLFALALVYFIYSLAEYFLNPESEEIRKVSKTRMIYGIIGLFIMTAVFGIENILINTIGVNNIKISNTGNYSVDNTQVGDPSKQLSDTPAIPYQNSQTEDRAITDDPGLPEPPAVKTYTDNPFPVSNPNANLCWRKTIWATGNTYYEATDSVKKLAKEKYLSLIGIAAGSPEAEKINASLPLLYGEKIYYDKTIKLFYAWEDIRAPIGKGKEADCSAVLSDITSQSKKISSLIGAYSSNNMFYQVVDSGVSSNKDTARGIAIENALIQIARLKGIYNISDISYNIIEEKYFDPDQSTGNYDYFVAIESPR